MKRIFYTILALSTALLVTTSCEDRGTTTEVVSANEDENVNPKHIRGYGDREPGGAPPSSPEAGQMYGFKADRYSSEFSNDLNLEGNLATEMVKIYYDRNRQLSELEQRYQHSETARMGGDANESKEPASKLTEEQRRAEQERINKEADLKVKEKLTPEQYKKYEMNKNKYHRLNEHN